MSAMSKDASGRDGPVITVTDIKLRIVEGGADNLLAWASCVINDAILLNNIAVRLGHEGGIHITYPRKQSHTGDRDSYFHPVNREAADVVERAIIAKIRNLSGIGRTCRTTAVENG